MQRPFGSAVLLSLACLGGAQLAESAPDPLRIVRLDAVVLHVRVADAALAALPPSFEPALRPELRIRRLGSLLEPSDRPMAIPGAVPGEVVSGQLLGDVEVIDAAVGAARDDSAIEVVRKASRLAEDEDTVYVDLALEERVGLLSQGGPWTCRPPEPRKVLGYAVTPRILDDGALEIELRAPKEDFSFSLWPPPPVSLRVEPGEAVLLALPGPGYVKETRVEVPSLARIPVLGRLFRSTRHEYFETRVLLVLSPRLIPA
jgi:hypothetical protein